MLRFEAETVCCAFLCRCFLCLVRRFSYLFLFCPTCCRLILCYFSMFLLPLTLLPMVLHSTIFYYFSFYLLVGFFNSRYYLICYLNMSSGFSTACNSKDSIRLSHCCLQPKSSGRQLPTFCWIFTLTVYFNCATPNILKFFQTFWS